MNTFQITSTSIVNFRATRRTYTFISKREAEEWFGHMLVNKPVGFWYTKSY